MYQTIEKHIAENCPRLFQLFANTVNGEEYMTSDLVETVDNLGSEREKDTRKAGINPVGFYELNDYYNQFVGFFFGFQLAASVMKEVK